MMTGMQKRIFDALTDLRDAVEEGRFGCDNWFDRDMFEAEFDDEVLVVAYVYDDELEEKED